MAYAENRLRLHVQIFFYLQASPLRCSVAVKSSSLKPNNLLLWIRSLIVEKTRLNGRSVGLQLDVWDVLGVSVRSTTRVSASKDSFARLLPFCLLFWKQITQVWLWVSAFKDHLFKSPSINFALGLAPEICIVVLLVSFDSFGTESKTLIATFIISISFLPLFLYKARITSPRVE